MKPATLFFLCLHKCFGFTAVRNIIFPPAITEYSTRENSQLLILSAEPKTDSYETSDSSSKGVVSSLTNLVNFLMGEEKQIDNSPSLPPPKTPQELMRLVQEDYELKNYLWTGNINLPAFEEDCTFTDPTLSFTGTQKFVSNVKNLVPIVEFLTQQSKSEEKSQPRSDLLDISINEEESYIQTRWNMVGDLVALPWKPAIDVIGRTKFWYRPTENESETGYRVYFYDEEWEVAASTALLQLVTPKGSIPNSTK